MSSRRPATLGPATAAVARKVRTLRTARGWSLRTVAERTQQIVPTMGADAINKLELGVRQITVEDLSALATVFGITAAALLEPEGGCSACAGKPPAGFVCLTCGTGASGNTTEPIAPPARKRRRNAVTDQHLRDVVAIYRAAREQGDAPTMAVAEQLDASHSTAARWVGMARHRGFLGPAVPGRAGGDLP